VEYFIVTSLLIFFSFFFFFQAEDGIRDRNVTGVQTCALPILTNDDPLKQYFQRHQSQYHLLKYLPLGFHQLNAFYLYCIQEPHRSEERRVGKECRSRWAAYQ